MSEMIDRMGNRDRNGTLNSNINQNAAFGEGTIKCFLERPWAPLKKRLLKRTMRAVLVE